MKGKSLLQRLDFIIVGMVVILAAALSGSALHFTLSDINLENQSNSLIPYVPKTGSSNLQLNSINFKNTQPTPVPIVFQCPGQAPPPPPVQVPPQQPAPTCPPVTCQSCDVMVGGCGLPWVNTMCNFPCPITNCATQCPAHAPPPPIVIPPVTPQPPPAQ